MTTEKETQFVHISSPDNIHLNICCIMQELLCNFACPSKMAIANEMVRFNHDILTTNLKLIF